jgi:hypothetical protein
MRASRVLIAICAALTALFAVGLGADGLGNIGSTQAAIELMAASLAVVWVGGGGAATLALHRRVRAAAQPARWQLRFVAFATALALLEEAVTTSLTNLAPLFGGRVGEAFITASSNYLEVVLYHSVIVFVPMFAAWAWLLKRYAFSPAAVLLLFGLNGVLAEAIFGGAQALLAAPFWILVYGLMVYLPACAVPAERGARPPRPWHFALAIVLPLLAAAAMAVVVLALSPHLPHFGPDFTQ